mgnify:FL=1
MYINRKGIQFGIKDTWSLDATLSPIILSALIKFKETINEPSRRDWVGVPNQIMYELFPDVEYNYSDEQLEKGAEYWNTILDKMIYAFDPNNEPKILLYGFKFNHESEKTEEGFVKASITPTNESEYQRYKNDEEQYWKHVDEGHLLFGKFFRSLWW